MSSDPCGCDTEAHHKCADHKIRAGLLSVEEVKREFMIWHAKLTKGGFGHADQIDFFKMIEYIAEDDR